MISKRCPLSGLLHVLEDGPGGNRVSSREDEIAAAPQNAQENAGEGDEPTMPVATVATVAVTTVDVWTMAGGQSCGRTGRRGGMWTAQCRDR